MQAITRFAVISALALAPLGVVAQGYAPGEREKLVESALPGIDGYDIAIQRVTFDKAWSGARHTHSGPVYVYVLDGSFEVEIEGSDTQTLSAGDLIAEPKNTAMIARNASASEPVTILLIQISEEGRPIMELVEN